MKDVLNMEVCSEMCFLVVVSICAVLVLFRASFPMECISIWEIINNQSNCYYKILTRWNSRSPRGTACPVSLVSVCMSVQP